MSAYVDRSLPQPVQLRYDRHLVTCTVCRASADAERRLLRSLRQESTVEVPTGLASALRQMALPATAPAPSLPVVAPDAPPRHRSPVRAAMFAGLTAAASAAAAWSLAVSGSAALPRSPAPVPANPTAGGTTAPVTRHDGPSAGPTGGAPSPMVAQLVLLPTSSTSAVRTAYRATPSAAAAPARPDGDANISRWAQSRHG